MRFYFTQNRTAYHHLTPDGWKLGTFVDRMGTLHENERPSETVYTCLTSIDEESGDTIMTIKERLADYEVINELFKEFGNCPPNLVYTIT